jgi:hypothetical protein
VQVLRDNVVRDIPVAVLAPIGSDRSFVSGPVDAADELIVSATQELADGTVVRSALPAVQQAAKPAGPNRTKEPGESPPRGGGL